ncbi:katanin p60 ATPase-containing subunit A1 [Trifolium repens]|nr:katanin p60 ATPase-containing subunit A1 [Trifolium repens]
MLERDVLESSPEVRWYDVGSLTEAKRLLGEAIVLEYSLYGCLNISRASGEHESSKRVKSNFLSRSMVYAISQQMKMVAQN